MARDKDLIEFKLDGGDAIIFETAHETSGGMSDVAKSPDGIKQANDQFEAVTSGSTGFRFFKRTQYPQ